MIYSLAYFRHAASVYETPSVGASQGVLFARYLPATLRAFYGVYGGLANLWIHHDDRVQQTPYWPVLRALHDLGWLRLIDCGVAPRLCEAMLWRMKPAWSTDQVVVCRDIDALPMPRERRMLEAFQDSAHIVHAMLDSESHSGPLMGGMVAVKGWRPGASWEAWTASADLERHGSDQVLLNASWRGSKPSTLVHQRRELAMYPLPYVETRLAESATEPGDMLAAHIGGMYQVGPVLEHYPNAQLDALERRYDCAPTDFSLRTGEPQ